MTQRPDASRPTVRVVQESEVPTVQLEGGGSQRVLLGDPHADGSPMMLGITRVPPGTTTSLIEHETAEVAFVVSGAGAIVTDEGQHDFGVGAALLIEAHCWHAIRAGDEEVTMVYGFPGPAVPATRSWQG